MTVADRPRFSPGWLELREPADARARSRELAVSARAAAARVSGGRPLVVHDLGCGTGSMGRWFAPELDGPQHWVLHDHDVDLLGLAVDDLPRHGTHTAPVTARASRGEVSALSADDLAGAALVTASALLDLLTRDEIGALAAACGETGCPALLTLSVVGRVGLTPEHPLDPVIGAAFDDHQRRVVAGRRLLGPDAVGVATMAFARRGAEIEVRPSAWRLGPRDAALAGAWLRGWVAAAAEQRPELPSDTYLRERLAQLEDARLQVTVHHADLLAHWP
ncbi:MAG TPA: SAM-dependent methyltransferase [Kineosporiaceae bacterium]|nr:SAM-dependent methyltransferase [Kineosporiaceae bacterium]